MNTENEHFYQIELDMENELRSSMDKYPLFNSAHEGYAVILEELDELWDELKKRKPDREKMRAEAIQVGAMAMMFIASMENGWKPSAEVKKSPEIVSEQEQLWGCQVRTMPICQDN